MPSRSRNRKKPKLQGRSTVLTYYNETAFYDSEVVGSIRSAVDQLTEGLERKQEQIFLHAMRVRHNRPEMTLEESKVFWPLVKTKIDDEDFKVMSISGSPLFRVKEPKLEFDRAEHGYELGTRARMTFQYQFLHKPVADEPLEC